MRSEDRASLTVRRLDDEQGLRPWAPRSTVAMSRTSPEMVSIALGIILTALLAIGLLLLLSGRGVQRSSRHPPAVSK